MSHIKDHAALLAACQVQAGQTRLFNLNLVDLTALFDNEVFGEIASVPAISILDHAVLTAYARGYLASLVHSIRTIECEFVYRSSTGVYFSTKVGTKSKPFYGDMSATERERSTSGYVWIGTNSPFTAFSGAVAVKEAA